MATNKPHVAGWLLIVFIVQLQSVTCHADRTTQTYNQCSLMASRDELSIKLISQPALSVLFTCRRCHLYRYPPSTRHPSPWYTTWREKIVNWCQRGMLPRKTSVNIQMLKFTLLNADYHLARWQTNDCLHARNLEWFEINRDLKMERKSGDNESIESQVLFLIVYQFQIRRNVRKHVHTRVWKAPPKRRKFIYI